MAGRRWTVGCSMLNATVLLTACAGGIDMKTVEPTPNAEPSAGVVANDSLVWNEASLETDWPGPLREEPLLSAQNGHLPHADRARDTGPRSIAGIDIATVELGELSPPPGAVVIVTLAGRLPAPVPHPRDAWIAYGLVLDTDGDGVGDVRLGVDNMPSVDEPIHRAWRTDLGTGDTDAAAGAPYGMVGDTYLDTFFPGGGMGNVARFGVALKPDESHFRFYTWSSVIEDGQIVATDYAPDAGWFDATEAANE